MGTLHRGSFTYIGIASTAMAIIVAIDRNSSWTARAQAPRSGPFSILRRTVTHRYSWVIAVIAGALDRVASQVKNRQRVRANPRAHQDFHECGPEWDDSCLRGEELGSDPPYLVRLTTGSERPAESLP
jgi:hypothetical protein